MNELMLLQQLGGGTSAWLHVTYLAGVFLMLIFRRENIAIPGMFKLSVVLFALSIMVQACAVPFATFNGLNSFGAGGDAQFALSLLISAAGPTLFALAAICLVLSMFPRELPKSVTAPPGKHPLD